LTSTFHRIDGARRLTWFVSELKEGKAIYRAGAIRGSTTGVRARSIDFQSGSYHLVTDWNDHPVPL